MKSRIQQIIYKYKYSLSAFAKFVDIQPAQLSHILSGRNNPSLDIVAKILKSFPDINYKWLIYGTGEMLNNGSSGTQNTLVDDNSVSEEKYKSPAVSKKVSAEKPVKAMDNESKAVVQVSETASDKKVKRVVVLYDDGTFSEYKMEKV